jgi:hypothetical protein
MFTFTLKGAALTVAAVVAVPPVMGQKVQVQFNLPGNNGLPTSMQDTYLFFGIYPGTTTPVQAFSEGTVSNGTTVTVTNPDITPGYYSFIAMGVYTDAADVAHAVMGTSNSILGGNWNAMFGSDNTKFDESIIISDLQNGHVQEPANLASIIVSDFAPQAYPISGYTGTPASGYMTGFSAGTPIGTITANSLSTPEPSPLLVLGLAPLALLRRRGTGVSESEKG